ncbi:MAG: HAD hydrolase family protein [Coriobacteriia bacterium]|nr:HAD hydrolase family protein [Coriobacteriia bacterium]MCL2606541.1 HAD hydrolase family protein [Coriobacteriia bacterium]
MKCFETELKGAITGSSADSSELLDMLRNVKVLYTDIDGTVLGKRGCLLVDGNNKPSINTATAIVEANLRASELSIVPCTGRSVTQLIEISRLFGWNDFIGEAGAVRSYWHADQGTRENAYDTPGWDVATRKLIANDNTPLDMINTSGAMDILFDAFPGQIEFHWPWNVNRQATNVLRGRVCPSEANALLTDISLPITLIENGVIAPSAHSLIDSDEPIRAYHLTPTGVTKGHAIRADLARRGITKKQAIMIGDGMADLECGPEVAAIVMVQNALRSPTMEASLTATPNAYVTRGAQGDGWAELTRAILAAKQ